MTTAAEASPLEARIGHHYQMDGTYLVGREKLREYARAVQDYHPAHWDVAAANELGYADVIAPITFTSTPGMKCNRRMFESIVVGYDTYLQTEEVFEQHRPIVEGDELTIDVELEWELDTGERMRTPELVVIETKSAAQPSELDRLLWSKGHRPDRISKYATGLAALRPELPANRWNRVLRHHFTSAPRALAA